MRDDILLILAIKDDVAVAGALNFIGAKTLLEGTGELQNIINFFIMNYATIRQ